MTTVNKHRRFLLSVAAATVILVLALGLGLGLGLGLKNGPSSQSSPTSLTFPPLQTQPMSNFFLDKLAGSPPQIRVFDFTLSQVQGAPDGFTRPMLVVNGIYPGPTIEANQADRLIVNVHNNLTNATSIHWHGLFQNKTNFYDGTSGITECGIPPGQSLTYNFTFGDFSGTTWWQYCSYVNSARPYNLKLEIQLPTQTFQHNTLTVYRALSSSTPQGLPRQASQLGTKNLSFKWRTGITTRVGIFWPSIYQSALVLSTCGCQISRALFQPFGIQGTPGNEPVPDAGTLNGLGQYSAAGSGGSYFSFTLQRNKTYRIRLCNTGSFASIRFSVDAHPLTLIEADGTLLAPSIISGITIAVAQRYSALLHANASAADNGTYWMRATVQSDMFTYDQLGQNLDIRGIIRYADAPALGLPGDQASPDPGPGVDNLQGVDGTTPLVPLAADPAPEVTRVFPLTFSFQNTNDGLFLGFMNSTSWSPLSGKSTLLAVRKDPQGYAAVGSAIAGGEQLIATVDSIQVVDIQIDNLDDGDHPFHLHGHRPWIMGAGDGRYIGQALNDTSPLRRDTVLIPAYTYLVLRFVTDNPGLWAFHCHLAWHMAAGLLMQFNSLPSQVAELDFPRDIIDQCGSS